MTLPANPFYASPEQRVALARQRFFEDGVRPSGMVSEANRRSPSTEGKYWNTMRPLASRPTMTIITATPIAHTT